uniref:Bcl-2 Bcl-2 homology region 1-3 domain-containing protein n=1 Tax=Eptatretus burgeri TaxID=7764 RepID=A0A8C4R0S3_EPTBU
MEDDLLMKETTALIKAYVMHRVAPDVPQPLNQAESVLIRLGDEVFSQHRETFREMLGRLYPNPHDLSNASSVAGTATRVAEEVFSDEEVNWGRLAAVIVLLATVAQEMDDRFGTVDERSEVLSLEMSRFVVENHGDWIRERGGWEDFVRRYKRRSLPSLRTRWVCAAVLCGIMASIVWFVRYHIFQNHD